MSLINFLDNFNFIRVVPVNKVTALPNYYEPVFKSLSVPLYADQKIEIELVDESYSEKAPRVFGTHKRHYALWYAHNYREFMSTYPNKPLPSLSLITSGSALWEFHSLFSKAGLPHVRCLISTDTPSEKKESYKAQGIRFFEDPLDKLLLSKDILRLTHNADGCDATSYGFPGLKTDPSLVYGYMAYEILFKQPDYIFVPFGSGLLFDNIKTHLEFLYPFTEKQITLIGMTVEEPNVYGGDKLYASFKPFSNPFEASAALGEQSGVYTMSEESCQQAHRYLVSEGIRCEASAAAGLAGVIQFKDQLEFVNKKIVVVSTGCAM